MSAFQDRIRKAPHFDPKNICVGGPINICLSCSSANTTKFVRNYEKINWNKKEGNHAKSKNMSQVQ